MFKILTCLVVEHDPRLVALAALICFLSSFGAATLLQRACAAVAAPQAIWIVAAGIASGFGIWATHFIAMLAYDPGVVIGYQMNLTTLSLAVAIVLTTKAIGIATYVKGRAGWLFGGLVLGAGVASMHFLGMAALDVAGSIRWDGMLVALSILAGSLFDVAALFAVARSDRPLRAKLLATSAMTLGIVVLHFTAMAAVTVEAGPAAEAGVGMMQPHLLAFVIAGTAFFLLSIVLIAAGFAHQAEILAAVSEKEFSRFVRSVKDYAICMLDIDGHVTSWNAGAESNKGYATEEIIGKNFACFYAPEERQANLPQQALHRALLDGKYEAEGWRYRKDGTRYWAHVVIEPIIDETGRHVGFIKIAKDISKEKANADRIAEVSKNLDIALENMTQGICLFDKADRLLISNGRCLEIFNLSESMAGKGLTFREIIERVSANAYPDPAVAKAKADAAYQKHRIDIDCRQYFAGAVGQWRHRRPRPAGAGGDRTQSEAARIGNHRVHHHRRQGARAADAPPDQGTWRDHRHR
ncbi:PAS domain S-box protein [Ensifer sp. IC3342]|nr:PAS domain S-box protein [Ensifer sp. BRP08]MCA1445626.1 PAS domain S-box protein [Ensifer sp. IC3342]